MNERIAVVGAGNIGRTLTRRFAEAGADVRVAVRDPESASARALATDLPDVPRAPVADAVGDADVVIVAVPGANRPAFIEEHGAALAGRLVLDASNDLSGGPAAPMHDMPAWRRLAPDAQVFRAFCHAGWETFANPDYDGTPADLFYCGPEGDPQRRAEALISGLGLRPVRLGDEGAADLVDSVARLWFTLAFTQGRGRQITFKLLERSATST